MSATGAAARLGPGLCVLALLALAAWGTTQPSRPEPQDPPATLRATGLYADSTTLEVAADNLAYAPQYPLWTDGALKRRWIHLPRGTSIDASDPDAWEFPVGTKLWKEFAYGRRVETRFMQRLESGAWMYATYLWREDGREAVLAPERGLRAAGRSPSGTPHDVPGVSDCRVCHEGHPSPVLGFGALQLSSDRDPLAPHGGPPAPEEVDLRALLARGLVEGLPPELVETPPRIEAASPQERAARGYLHGNCAGCHNARGPLAGLGLDLEARLGRPGASLATLLDRPSTFQFPGETAGRRVVPGDPEHSVLLRRMATRSPLVQMPPLGTHAVDAQALELVASWLRGCTAAEAAPAPLDTTLELLSRL